MDRPENNRLSLERRTELVLDIVERGLSVRRAALRHGVSAPTARKWAARYRERGVAGLADASSRPVRSPRAIEPATRHSIVQMRQQRLTHTQIARALGVSSSTVGRVLARTQRCTVGA